MQGSSETKKSLLEPSKPPRAPHKHRAPLARAGLRTDPLI